MHGKLTLGVDKLIKVMVPCTVCSRALILHGIHLVCIDKGYFKLLYASAVSARAMVLTPWIVLAPEVKQECSNRPHVVCVGLQQSYHHA